VEFASRREYVDGHAVCSQGVGGCKTGVFREVIAGTPVMLQIYPKGNLTLTAASGVLSSMNLGHAQAMDIISGRSRRGGQGPQPTAPAQAQYAQ